jgi:Zn-dependent protease with chaperone function
VEGHRPSLFYYINYCSIVLSILASIIVMWFSRRREYKADSGAALLVGKEKMISALKVLGKQSTDPLPDQMAAFGISGNKKKISSLFSSHPSIEKRISALLNL